MEKMIEKVTDKIDVLKNRYLDNKDYYVGLPHVFFSDEVVPYTCELVRVNKEEDLKTLFKVIEGLLTSEENKNVIHVSFIENLYYENEYTLLKKYFKDEILDMAKQIENDPHL